MDKPFIIAARYAGHGSVYMLSGNAYAGRIWDSLSTDARFARRFNLSVAEVLVTVLSKRQPGFDWYTIKA